MPPRRVVALGPHHAQVAEVGQRVADRGHLPVEHRRQPRGRVGGEDRVAQPVVAVHDRRRAGARHVLGQPAADALDRGDLARLVQLPQPAEAPQLALQVAARLAEALQAHRLPVHGVDLDERVDQLLGDPRALRRACPARAAPRTRSPRPRCAPSRRTGSRSPPGPRTPRAPRARARACRSGPSAGAPRAARRGRSAAAAGAAGGAARPRRRRARSGRSRWSGRRRSAAPRSRPRRGRARPGRRRSGSSTSSGGRALAAASACVATMSSGATVMLMCETLSDSDRNLLRAATCLKRPCCQPSFSPRCSCCLVARRARERPAGAAPRTTRPSSSRARRAAEPAKLREQAIAQMQPPRRQSAARRALLEPGRARAPRARAARTSKRPTRPATTGAATTGCSPRPRNCTGRCCSP